jgi:aminoglycoside 3-N-acetyltransferase
MEALLDVFSTVIMPVFTYATMVTPEVGPPYNGLTYGAEDAHNRQAQFFDPDLPADRLMGVIPESLRRHPKAQRSSHPILSFSGVNAAEALHVQTLQEPLAPIQALLDGDGWALLLGVDHTVNTSIHLGERLAGRQPFLRWALTPDGVAACPGFPGCSDGFQALAPALTGSARTARIGAGLAQAFRLADLVEAVQAYLKKDPLGLLCNRSYCARCFDARRRMEN